MAGQKKRQKGNPPVRTKRVPQGAWRKQIRENIKRLNKKPQIPRGR